jgi:hypothetical protein
MKIVRVMYGTSGWGTHDVLVRDPVVQHGFLCGVRCNEHGVGMRDEGCSEDAELRILWDSIESYEEVTDDLRSVLVRSGFPGGDPDSDLHHAPGSQGASGGFQPEAEVGRSIQMTPRLRNVLLFVMVILLELVLLLGMIMMLRSLSTR